MTKYDYFIAGRWRNHKAVREVLSRLRNEGKSAYCFIENAYAGDGIVIDTKPKDVHQMMSQLETVDDWATNATFRKIYENDMNGLKNAKEFILVFPAGLSAHMELGVAFGLGKKCYGIGQPDKYETLYLMLEHIYPDADSFIKRKQKVAA